MSESRWGASAWMEDRQLFPSALWTLTEPFPMASSRPASIGMELRQNGEFSFFIPSSAMPKQQQNLNIVIYLMFSALELKKLISDLLNCKIKHACFLVRTTFCVVYLHSSADVSWIIPEIVEHSWHKSLSFPGIQSFLLLLPFTTQWCTLWLGGIPGAVFDPEASGSPWWPWCVRTINTDHHHIFTVYDHHLL